MIRILTKSLPRLIGDLFLHRAIRIVPAGGGAVEIFIIERHSGIPRYHRSDIKSVIFAIVYGLILLVGESCFAL